MLSVADDVRAVRLAGRRLQRRPAHLLCRRRGADELRVSAVCPAPSVATLSATLAAAALAAALAATLATAALPSSSPKTATTTLAHATSWC